MACRARLVWRNRWRNGERNGRFTAPPIMAGAETCLVLIREHAGDSVKGAKVAWLLEKFCQDASSAVGGQAQA